MMFSALVFAMAEMEQAAEAALPLGQLLSVNTARLECSVMIPHLQRQTVLLYLR
jgi:hypothetical protein